MSHHGNNPLDPNSKPPSELLEKMAKQFQRKLMGEYPDGRLNDDDSGAVSMAIASQGDKVLLQFPKPVAWVGLTGDQAMQLAQDLMKHARRAGITAPFVLRVGE